MTQHMFAFIRITILVVSFCLAPAYGQNDIESPEHYPGVWYRLLVDGSGNYVEGQGDGEGWYYYPESNTWRMWFYNGSYDADRQGSLEYQVYTKAIDPTVPTYMEAYCGWTTPAWSKRGTGRPPLPSDMPTLSQESQYLYGARIYGVNSVVTTSVESNREYLVEEYNPEWICIGLKVRNAYVYRGVFHECTSGTSPRGACCNQETGYCYSTYETHCVSPMVWLGAGTSCDECTEGATLTTDFGDAPDWAYLTLLSSNGARHTIVPGVYLGDSIDGESNGQPSTLAAGDDGNGADEDGVLFTSTLQAGQEATIQVTASTAGYLNAWVDFDGDDRFDDGDDQIFADQILKSGTTELTFTVPRDAVCGDTFARFRFNTRGLVDSCGLADDGEVEDYRVQIVGESQDSYAVSVSGASSLVWSQPPSLASDAEATHFEGGSMSSSLHLREMAADDWEPVDGQPVTGIHWWGVFDGWTESHPPSELPVAFHIGIWTDAQVGPGSFAHPDTLVWETYCANWAWALSGTDQSDSKAESGQTCFLFSCQLSQDQWIQIDQTKDTGAKVYWLSIAALYDSTEEEPENIWNWKLRSTASGAAGTSVRTVEPASGSASWPPTVGAQWASGGSFTDAQFNPVDMAFQLTTFVPLEFDR